MADQNPRPGPSNSNPVPKPSFKLEMSDLSPEMYLAVQKALEPPRFTSTRSTIIPYRTVPTIAVSYKQSSASRNSTIQRRGLDRRPPPTRINLNPPSTTTGSRWCIRSAGRAGRPRGSRALRPRVGSYTSKFANVAKNLSYRGCLSDILSRQGGLSRLQIVNKTLASSFQKYLKDAIAAKQARERGLSSDQKYEPISPPSGEAQDSDGAASRSGSILPASTSNVSPENRSYSPIIEPVSPEAGPSGLQSSTHFESSPTYISEEQLYQEGNLDALLDEEEGCEAQKNEDSLIEIASYQDDELEAELQRYENELLGLTQFHERVQEIKDVETNPEEVNLYKNPSPEVIEIKDSDDEEPLEKLQGDGETFVSDLYTISQYYAPPTVEVYPPTVAVDPPTVEVFTPTMMVNPPTVAANPPTVSVYPPTVAVNPPTVAVSPATVSVYPPTVAVNPPTVEIYTPPAEVKPPTVEIYTPPEEVKPPSVELSPPTVTVYSDDSSSKFGGSTTCNRFRRRTQYSYRARGCVPGTYIKLSGSRFYGNRNLELETAPPVISPVGPPLSGRGITQSMEQLTVSPPVQVIDDDEDNKDEERLLASPSYDVPELDLFTEDGMSEALSYVRKQPSPPKPQTAKTDKPEDIPGPSGVVPPKKESKRGQKSSRRKSTVRLATPRPARPSRAKSSRSITGVRSTISDLTELCGKVKTTTEKETLPCGRKVFVGGGLPPFRIPPSPEVQKTAVEAIALGHQIRTSQPSQEEDVLEDIVSWLMDNPEEEEYQRMNPYA